MEVLTERQLSIYKWMWRYRESNGYPPTIREIMERFEITPNGVTCHLRALQAKGYIRREYHQARAIQFLVEVVTDES